jgi:hypothetical protein
MDTIHFRIHRLKETYPIIHQALLTKANTLKETSIVVVSNGEARDLVATDRHDRKDKVLTMVLNHHTNEMRVVTSWEKVTEDTSLYEIAYCVDWNMGWMDVNISVPKYWYGANVLQAIMPPHHREYNAGAASPFSQINYWIELITATIDHFIKVTLARGLPVEIDWTHIQITRVDIAVNQLHESAESVQLYLQYIQGISKKGIEPYHENEEDNEGKVIGKHATGITYKTDRYKFKIYHKGPEFRKQAAKINATLAKRANKKMDRTNPTAIDNIAGENRLQYLQNLADKTLRYELEFRSPLLSYLWNRLLQYHWSKDWQHLKKAFNKLNKPGADLSFLRPRKVYVDFNGCLHDEKIMVYDRVVLLKRVVDDSGKSQEVELTRTEKQIVRILRKMGYNSFELKKFVKAMEKSLNMGRKCMIKLPGGVPDTTRPTVNILNKELDQPEVIPVPESFQLSHGTECVRFSKKLMFVMVKMLKNYFDQFQVVEKPKAHELTDKIKKHNQKVEARISTLKNERFVGKEEEARIRKENFIGKGMERNLKLYDLYFSKKENNQRDARFMGYFGSRSTFLKIRKLYIEVTGIKEQIAHAHFGIIERDFDKIFQSYMIEMQYGMLGEFYKNFANQFNMDLYRIAN